MLLPALTSGATNYSVPEVEYSSFTAQSSCVCFGSKLKDQPILSERAHELAYAPFYQQGK